LTENNSGKIYNDQPAKFLYAKLVTPVLDDINNIRSLIIIPDENLINVPFEAFESADDNYLIQSFAVTYQYALPLLQVDKTKLSTSKAVAFAPFAYSNNHSNMNVLPASLDEISSFPKSAQLVSDNATKEKFFTASTTASVIHLATHAVVNFKEPENSYIVFYEKNKTDSDYKIFAHELYNLQLPRTQLVFLSACETGTGKLSQSEGVLSLSRAFAFAGCPNIVTSLWKAEDNSTAYISKKFYSYVGKGYSYAQALQKAKTDLLDDATMSQFHSPVYWSHLIFIGDVQQEKSFAWIWIIAGCVVVIIALLLFHRKKIFNH
ncbi:MAG TPA: CHAT domain-containing protein, partial [Chitinophagaceae bacterium]